MPSPIVKILALLGSIVGTALATTAPPVETTEVLKFIYFVPKDIPFDPKAYDSVQKIAMQYIRWNHLQFDGKAPDYKIDYVLGDHDWRWYVYNPEEFNRRHNSSITQQPFIAASLTAPEVMDKLGDPWRALPTTRDRTRIAWARASMGTRATMPRTTARASSLTRGNSSRATVARTSGFAFPQRRPRTSRSAATVVFTPRTKPGAFPGPTANPSVTGRPTASPKKPERCPIHDVDTDYYGNDIKMVHVRHPYECCDQCARTPGCAAYTFHPYPETSTCFLKSKAGRGIPARRLVSGILA